MGGCFHTEAPPLNREAPPLNPLDREDFIQKVTGMRFNAPSYLSAAPAAVKADKDCVLAAVKESGMALEYAAHVLRADKEVVLSAVAEAGLSFQFASDNLKSDKSFTLDVVKINGYLGLPYAADTLKADKEVVLASVTQNGMALQHASRDLRKDKDVVMAAAKQRGAALKFAMDGLNQDPDCLKAAGLFDEDADKTYPRLEKATLSIKFSLAEKSTSYATEFAKAMKDDHFLGQFKTYNPNTWCKKSCDPKFTNMKHPCRGSPSTCQFQSQNLNPDTLRPCADSCWRFAFRFHQEESKDSKGFMIQVEEDEKGLGDGQQIETEMAREVQLKVFRTYTSSRLFDRDGIKMISNAVQEWYESGCVNNDLENVFIGDDRMSYAKRPKYEKL